jgi:hypothetical protein
MNRHVVLAINLLILVAIMASETVVRKMMIDRMSK